MIHFRVLPLIISVLLLLATVLETRSQDKTADEESAAKRGEQISAFARDRLGKKVGDGECTTLVRQALEAAGAKTTADYGVTGPDADYIWGNPLARYEDVQPGDILQFRNVKIVTKTVTKTETESITRTAISKYRHHTAIVAANLGDAKFTILHQNAGSQDKSEAEKKVVQEMELNVQNKTEGELWVFRPEKK